MKEGGSSSLNPYAASYVPISRRGAADVNNDNEVGRFGHWPVNTLSQDQHQIVSQSHPQSAGATQTAVYPNWNDNYSSEFSASTSQFPNEMPGQPNVNEYSEMDLAYLQMTFPGVSMASLSQAYNISGKDLDSAIEMLSYLEDHPDESTAKLPDTLDIGDELESGHVKAPQEAKNDTAAGASTSAASADVAAKT